MTMTAARSGTLSAAGNAPPSEPSPIDVPAVPVDAQALGPVAAVHRALGDQTRLLILRHLVSGEHNVRELTEHLHLAQSTVSAHLACLRDCGLVAARPVGRSSMYALRDPELLMALLSAAEEVVSSSGDASAGGTAVPGTSVGGALL